MSTQPTSSPDYSRVSDTNGLAALRVGAAQSMAYYASLARDRRVAAAALRDAAEMLESQPSSCTERGHHQADVLRLQDRATLIERGEVPPPAVQPAPAPYDSKTVLEQHQLREIATGGLHGTFVVCSCEARLRLLSEHSPAEAMAEHQAAALRGAL